MHLGLKQLAGFFAAHGEDKFLVLATVVGTEGSTYRKPGAMMLISADGSYAGLISGGCLEADLVQRAMEVMQDGLPRKISYDLHDDPDLLFSLGLGCGGDIHLLLQRFSKADDFGLLPVFFQAWSLGRKSTVALLIESDADPEQIGSWAYAPQSGAAVGDEALREMFSSRAAKPPKQGRCEVITHSIAGNECQVLVIEISVPPRVLICGGGPDAVPLSAQISGLGWKCTVVDHRPAYAKAGKFPDGVDVLCHRPADLTGNVDIAGIDAAIVMSHHMEHDQAYLQALLQYPLAYTGLLGPAKRRETLLAKLGVGAKQLRGPAGLDIGAEMPEAIALAVAAEIHACLNDRHGGPLTHG